ncbi:FecR domain-containing protein [uncultured Desulfosarcina sp.]|uniref:FecR domain-containing protein n=1 Tax=uncultured Desulfosarcina sp. TaxID=218289 RepID=UPI0029C93933|nr:FecR domain-containing protein [uncultured Desulfosarcina sp.]
MNGVAPYFVRFFVAVSLFMGIPGLAVAATANCDPSAARAVSVQGAVESRSPGGGQWQQVTLDDTFCPGDEVRVLDNSRASLALANESVLRLNANSSIVVQKFEEKTSFIDVFKGAAHLFARKPNKLEVNTPYVVAGVRGTEFLVRVEDDQTFLSVFEGSVLASNDAGEVALASGQSAVAKKGSAPVLTTVVNPRDAVQWALYYPPVVYVPPGQPEMREDLNDSVFLANRASQSLSVGNIDAAESDLQKALAMDPKMADALSLSSIVALVRNDKEKAYELAQQAVAANPKSATALVAKSYAQQARFDLEGARKSLMDAVAASPDDALTYARLAEIQLSFGELDKALQSAQKAATLAPDLSRTQTVLGFANLTQVKTDDAKAAFEKAIQTDQVDPLPRLGIGLAKIREGQLEAGRMDLEVAASLDPNNSLIRSYLGKAYYEEKRTGLDEREYKAAKELDPNDPTPWFYEAIAKQTTNRPVEALQDLQKAIELNDNRAVYRSKLTLDSDLAARSASQARIYSDLGFQQRALVEGYNAVNTDPTNYSAHRFLADSYSVLPRHEIARVSELLQSQLLQPNNITPIQPSLAESNLYLISSGGAANTSFNEFNPLFNRNRATVQAFGLIGEDNTWGGEGVIAGIYNRLSMSAGYSNFETDGWRTNADQEDKIANFFAQYEITHKTSLQAEYRYREIERGDTQLRFFEEDFDVNLRQNDEIDTIRVGIRHAFSPESIILGNFAYQDGTRKEQTKDEPVLQLLDLEGDDEAYSGELQYLFRSKPVKIVGGVGYFDIDTKEKLTTVLELFPGFTITDVVDIDAGLEHNNLYLYSYWDLIDNLTFTLGASGDFLDSETEDIKERDQFNPKFGINWSPLTGTTIRAAAFRVLKRTLITDQTLEPTQIAGFNQFFDDDNSTDAWRYGVGIDQKFTKTIFGGLEYSDRDLEVPYQDIDLNTGALSLKDAEWDESLFRAYLFWAPHPMFSFSAEYMYEEYERDEAFAFGVKNVDTSYFPLGINFFHPTGLSASIKGTYVDQKGEFERGFMVFESGEDDFWLVDASISFRFPKRYGFLTVGASNLLDESFKYFDTDPENPRIQPARTVFAKITLAFP